MKQIYLGLLLVMFSSILFGQEAKTEKKEPFAKFSGYIVYRAFIDTYDSYDAREGNIYLFPKQESLDVNGDDINKFTQFEGLALDTRVRVSINGPNAFGAKVSGLIEADWMGTSNSYTRMPRLRHAFVKLSWEKVNVLAGQYWHPVFTPECFPKTISFGAALPFNPLNRSPQARVSLIPVERLHFLLAISSYGYHNFSGTDIEAQRNSGIPDFHGQIMFKSDIFTIGAVAGVKTLKPRLVTDAGVKTGEKLHSVDVKGFISVKVSKLVFNTAFMIGENLSPYVMIGGYGATTPIDNTDPNYVDDFDYVNLKSMSVWGDFDLNLHPIKIGLFYGYSANLGASKEYYSISSARAEGVKNIMRLSPRVTYTSGKVSLALEYMLSTAVYGNTWNEKHKVTNSDDMVANNRVQLAVKYVF